MSSLRSPRIVDPSFREKKYTSFTMNSSDQNLLSQCNSRSGSKLSLVDSMSGQRRLSVAATATMGSEVASAGGNHHRQRPPGQTKIPMSFHILNPRGNGELMVLIKIICTVICDNSPSDQNHKIGQESQKT